MPAIEPDIASMAHKSYIPRPVNPTRLAAIKEHGGARILDAGCGNGSYVNLLAADYDIHGIDQSPFVNWEENPDRFGIGDVGELQFENEDFETIFSFEVLEHVPKPEQALQEFYRVTSRNVILTVPNCEIPQGIESSRLTFFHYTDRTHINFFTLSSIIDLCESVGFNVVESQLINPVNLSPLLSQSYALPRVFVKMMQRYLRRGDHYMTCLIVANK